MRIATLALAAVCISLVGAGGAWAVSGSSGNGSAGVAQYPLTPQVPQGGGGPEGEGETLGQGDEGQPGGAVPEDEIGDVQAEVQAQAGGDDGLPFTGIALIGLLLAGTALLGAGLLLRRGARAPAS